MRRVLSLFFVVGCFFQVNCQITEPVVLGYFPSWSETWTSPGQNSTLREVPSFITHLFLSFAKPDLTYEAGSYNISGTGLDVPYDGCTLKESVEALSAKGIQVILSIGGETYWSDPSLYDNIDYSQIKDLVDDIGFAGIDWDFEPNGSFANIGSTENIDHFVDFISFSRNLMPQEDGYIIACAPAGAGALGVQMNNDALSPFAFENRNALTGENDDQLYIGSAATNGINLFGFSATGHMIPVFEQVGGMIDLVAFQGYNTGGSLNRTIMYESYAYYAEQYDFKIAAGVHFPEEPWGPYYTYTELITAELAEFIRDYPSRIGDNDGLMIWQILLEDATSSAYDYMHIGSQVLNGSSVEDALADSDNYSLEPYSGGSEGCNITAGDYYCGAFEYDVTLNYPTPGALVHYDCAIWTNQWWANPGEIPGENAVWSFVSECTESVDCSDCPDGEILGCMDAGACNYDVDATCDNGSCLYLDVCGICGGTSTIGCDDPSALNYDPNADCSDGSCIYEGCTYSTACNYNVQAAIDDGSCEFPGCQDPLALNYDLEAGCEGACYYADGSELPMDVNNDCIVNTLDLLLFLGAFGDQCE
jgi:chitinase